MRKFHGRHFLRLFLICIAFANICPTSTYGMVAQSDAVVKVNGRAITFEEFDKQVKVNRYIIEGELNNTNDLNLKSNIIYAYKKKVLDRMINDTLVIMEGEKNNNKVSESLIKSKTDEFMATLQANYLEDYPQIFTIGQTTEQGFRDSQHDHIKAQAMMRLLFIPSELSSEQAINQALDGLKKNADIQILMTRYSESAQRYLQQVFPQATYFVKQEVNPSHYLAYYEDPKTEKRKALGFCYETSNTNPDDYGYSSRINILVGIDRFGKITGAKVVKEDESGFLARAILHSKRFADQFKGKSLKDKLAIGEDLDAVSGATVSLKVAASTIRSGGRLIATQFYQAKFKSEQTQLFAPGDLWRLAAMAFLFAVAMIGTLMKMNRLRYVVLGVSLVVLGFLSKDYLSITHFTSIASGMLPALTDFVLWYLILALGLLVTLIFGRLYCGWLCPFGAIQEMLTFIKPFQKRIHLGVERWAEKLKYLVLLLTVALVILGNNKVLEVVEPFSTLFNHAGNMLMFIVLFLAVLPNLFIYRFYCRFFCPLGAVLAIITLISFNKINRREACVSCRQCENICRFEAIRGGAISKSECIRCADCERSFIDKRCPDQKA